MTINEDFRQDLKILKEKQSHDPSINIGDGHNGHVIHFVHIATKATCHFKAFLTAWEDNFKQDWSSYETVGRMDPVRTYKRTSRTINFSFDIPSFNKEDAARNLYEVQTLIQMSYPTFNQYSTVGKEVASSGEANAEATQQKRQADEAKITDNQRNLAGTVSHMVSPPFLRIKFSNWLNDSSLDPAMSNNDAYGPDHDAEDKSSVGSGLFGTIENVKFSPDLNENGGFYGATNLYYPNSAAEAENLLQGVNEKILIPKLLKMDIVFNVLHTNELGFYASSGRSRTQSFPYNANRIISKMAAEKRKSIKVT
jgi:hypothetical protein